VDTSQIAISYERDSSLLTEEQARWLDQLPGAPREGKATILERLRQAEPAGRRPLHFTGLAFALLGSPAEAMTLFEQAASVTTPPHPIDVLNIAVALVALGELDLARARLGLVADGTGQASERARQYIAELDRVRGELDRDARLKELQAAALTERVAAGGASIGERIRLARLAWGLAERGRPGHDHEAPTRLLEQVNAEDPQNVEALELLALCYLKTGHEGKLNATLRELERLAPDSRIWQVLDRPIPDAAVDAHTRNIRARTSRLFEEVQGGGPGADAALESLRTLSRQFPGNMTCHEAAMWALTMTGHVDEGLVHAEWIAQQPDLGHGSHFNVGQIFWHAGQHERAEHHLLEAFHLAADQQEAADAIQMLQYLRRQG
jgi:tetratricopeptide (TPR) repeat protein